MNTYTTAAFLAGVVVNVKAHGHMKQPIGPPSMLVDVADVWRDHWFTQGSMIGCAEPTGTNCNAESPCCASDQLASQTRAERSAGGTISLPATTSRCPLRPCRCRRAR